MKDQKIISVKFREISVWQWLKIACNGFYHVLYSLFKFCLSLLNSCFNFGGGRAEREEKYGTFWTRVFSFSSLSGTGLC